MQHLLSIDDLSTTQVQQLLQQAMHFKQQPPKLSSYPPAATLFYEHSTRTFMSFSLAAQRLGISLTALAVAQSSVQKGETLLDTLLTLHAMGIKLLIIRHPTSYVFEPLLPHLPADLHLLNAGDGQNEHPSQALLDMMTVLEHQSDLSTLKIAMVGDIRHSRVAQSLQKLCHLLGTPPLTLITPPQWAPAQPIHGTLTTDLRSGLAGAQVVIALRIQRERLDATEQYCSETYHEQYGLTTQTLAYAAPKAMVLHPGPIQRGIEIDADVADGPQSYILKQVENGVWMRMAILVHLLSTAVSTAEIS